MLLTVQHGYPIIMQCSESFSLEKLYFRLNNICGVLQLYDPVQGLQLVSVFFLSQKLSNYYRLNDICGVLQLYDPAQGLQHSACFFLVTKTGKSANKIGGPVS